MWPPNLDPLEALGSKIPRIQPVLLDKRCGIDLWIAIPKDREPLYIYFALDASFIKCSSHKRVFKQNVYWS